MHKHFASLLLLLTLFSGLVHAQRYDELASGLRFGAGNNTLIESGLIGPVAINQVSTQQ